MLGVTTFVYFVTIDAIYLISSGASTLDAETSQGDQDQMICVEDFKLGDIALSGGKNSLIKQT